jgi:hypothetical protein
MIVSGKTNSRSKLLNTRAISQTSKGPHLSPERGRDPVLQGLPRGVFVVYKAPRLCDSLVQLILLEHAAQLLLADGHVNLGRKLENQMLISETAEKTNIGQKLKKGTGLAIGVACIDRLL